MEGEISKRKDSHLDIAANRNVQYARSGGFEEVMLVHCALPEVDLAKVDTGIEFLGKKLSAPILITGMTGGTSMGEEVNKKLAKAAEEARVALGLGSQRAMLRDKNAATTYKVRKLCPSVPLIGNIGGVQLREYSVKQIEGLVSDIEADALNVHLNALQEAIQPEGETNFAGVAAKIGELCDSLKIPVIAKETGAGITAPVAKKLFDAGCKYVEVSGSGGTSWSKVEYARGGRLPGFEEWGFPTTVAVAECAPLGNIIASGGIREGLDIAKSIALGAKLGGAAMPFFKADKPEKVAAEWKEQIRTAAFLCGCKNMEELGRAPVLITGKGGEIAALRGVDVIGLANRAAGIREEGRAKPGRESHYI